MAEKRLDKTWEVAMRGNDGEWDIATLHSYDHREQDLGFEAATPAKITPSRRKKLGRSFIGLAAYGDTQIDYRRLDDGTLEPIHDESAMSVARQLIRDFEPDVIINLGDTVDLAALSRFKPDSDHFQRTLGPAFQRAHDYWAELKADNPDAKLVEVDSNHNTRLRDFVLKNASPLHNLKQASAEEEDYPVMTYPHLANLKHLGVEWVSGYGAAEYVHGEEYGTPPVVFRHGTETSQNGTTAAKIMKNNPDNHAVQGHDHSMQRTTRTDRNGRVLEYLTNPALCRTTGEVPSFHSAVSDRNQVVKRQENWQQGVTFVRDYGGEYEFEQVKIERGRAFWRGQEYRAEE